MRPINYFKPICIIFVCLSIICLFSFDSKDDIFKCVGNTRWKIDKIYLDSTEIHQSELELLLFTFKKSGIMVLSYNNESRQASYFYNSTTNKITLNFPDDITTELDVIVAQPYCLIIRKTISDHKKNSVLEYRFKPFKCN